MSSPELSPTQRSATVTLGTTGGDIVVTLSDENARFRRFSRAACMFVAASIAFKDLRSSGILEPNAECAPRTPDRSCSSAAWASTSSPA